MRLKLIIDDRERASIPYLETEMYNIGYEVQRIAIGDYIIIDEKNKIIACFERKTLEDFASSIKDGRYGNKDAMIELREKTKCQLFFIVEGEAYPSPDKHYSNMPYKYIESAIFHLMFRDNIHIIETNSPLHTVQKLARMIESIRRYLETTINYIIDKIYGELYGLNTEIPKLNIILKKEKKKDIDIVREMWSCFRGISTLTADNYISQSSIKKVIKKEAEIEKLKYTSGKPISNYVIDSLTHIDKNTEIRLLACIPGISQKSAKEILGKMRLNKLLDYNKIEEIPIGKRKLGNKAEKIKKYFEYQN